MDESKENNRTEAIDSIQPNAVKGKKRRTTRPSDPIESVVPRADGKTDIHRQREMVQRDRLIVENRARFANRDGRRRGLNAAAGRPMKPVLCDILACRNAIMRRRVRLTLLCTAGVLAGARR
jgi:hypothetical protein